MKPPRVSIAGLMTVVLVAAIAIASLRYASDLWAGIMLMLTLALLAASVLGVVYRTGRARAGWLGFAVFAGGYTVLAFGPWFVTELQPRLPTSLLLSVLHERMAGQSAKMTSGTYTVMLATAGPNTNSIAFTTPSTLTTGAAGPTGAPILGPGAQTMTVLQPTKPFRLFVASGVPEDFQRVGHSLAALLAGVVGVVVGRWFESSRRREEPNANNS
jgi:hypothetical protein